mgnify:CR=1 FL=1
MDILLLERLVPEAMAWLESRHGVEYRPELASDVSALRKMVYKAEAVVLPRKVVVTRPDDTVPLWSWLAHRLDPRIWWRLLRQLP